MKTHHDKKAAASHPSASEPATPIATDPPVVDTKLREDYVGRALQGILASDKGSRLDPPVVAQSAVDMADAVLAVLNKKPDAPEPVTP